ncbi:hypothetical protein [Thermococcus sp. MV11]|uniref:hypothetical protein n=1 Tax=Thermococcus sp. MV11 TaxID=1638267 RepID=UPI001430EF00|nr:hypothetical protein [Thermococcus sp. MV11]NJE03374.1 hypothetical protein [Thermococcus sp. MV11]
MKRRETSVEINAPRENIERILEDAPQFITNWPYVVKVSTKNGVQAEILLPRFVFKFGDTYAFTVMTDSSSYIYEGIGRKSHLTATVTLKEWQKSVTANVELSYQGRGELLLGKPLEILTKGIARSLKELAENLGPIPSPSASSSIVDGVDFSDPMSVATFLSKSKMVHSGLHIVQKGGLLNVITEIRDRLSDSVLYVSGVTQDGSRSFKLLLRGSQVLAVEYRDQNGSRVVKVEDENTAREALEIVSGIEGAYMVNVWVPVGGA